MTKKNYDINDNDSDNDNYNYNDNENDNNTDYDDDDKTTKDYCSMIRSSKDEIRAEKNLRLFIVAKVEVVSEV